jgi:formate dehydrogenase subunit beta
MTSCMLKTNGDPLAAARQFLKSVWSQANLQGMLVPLYQPDQLSVKSVLIEDPASLKDADPFVPLMLTNAGKLVVQIAREHPGERLAAVLRACEIRALAERIKSESLNIDNWLIIGVDCLACFPANDFEWRVQKAGRVEELTHLVMRNARQGGISLSRFRLACQMCSKPEPIKVDLCLGLLGLPVKETMLILPKDDSVTGQLHLHEITEGPAPVALVAQHDRIMTALNERRQHFRDRAIRDLPSNLPANLEELVKFLSNCAPCQVCLASCPLYEDELAPVMTNGSVSLEAVRRWLVMCAECGMCEQACPKDVPLAAIMNRISRKLQTEVVAV